MREWSYSLHDEALHVFLSMKGRRQHELLRFFEKLTNDPEMPGDFTERDDTGRNVRAKVIGKTAVYWWLDSPVWEIKIVHLRPADR